MPLARARDPEVLTTNQVVIWANTYGSGRVFGTTLGHANTTVSNTVYLDLLTRGLLWACGRLDDVADLRVTSIVETTPNNVVRWLSVPGWSYTIESALYAGGPWNPLTNASVTASNVTSAFVITNFAEFDEPQRFFRVRLSDP
ncbi:MAG: hypothetical protein HY301_17110 [Verrucomicrobia bacterium]|nr:hypothetical protein [Verrucomicrobiota bacterium]